MATFPIKRNDTLPIFKVQAVERGTNPSIPINLRLPEDIGETQLETHIFLTMIKARHEIQANNVPTLQSLNANSYVLRLQIDNFDAISVDVTGNEGVTPVDYTLPDILSNINAALQEIDDTLSKVAREVNGHIILVSPSNSSVSRILIHNDNLEVRFNAISALMGITTNSGDVNSNEGQYRLARTVVNRKEIPTVPESDLVNGLLRYQFTSTETSKADLYIAEFAIEYGVNGASGIRSVPLSLEENLYVSVVPDVDAT